MRETTADGGGQLRIIDPRVRTSKVVADDWDAPPAVFKTVCGALLRRPGWVRFPSIPARFARRDSQDDSHKLTATALDVPTLVHPFYSAETHPLGDPNLKVASGLRRVGRVRLSRVADFLG
jgi:hypothetical protein